MFNAQRSFHPGSASTIIKKLRCPNKTPGDDKKIRETPGSAKSAILYERINNQHADQSNY